MTEAKVGVVYSMQPEPPEAANTRWFEAGPIKLGLEYRVVDPARLAEAYADSAEDLAELEANSPEGGFSDRGVSIHVVGADDDHEYLRFDAFEDDPHYHYVRPSLDFNHWVPFDAIAGGDILDFTFRCLRERLPAMLAYAGGERIAERLDPERLEPALEEVEQLAYATREEQRAAS